jgi:hypothetical protein
MRTIAREQTSRCEHHVGNDRSGTPMTSCERAGMASWTAHDFTAAIAKLSPEYISFEKLLRGLVTGTVALSSGAVLCPDLFGSRQVGLDASCLGLPQVLLHGACVDTCATGGVFKHLSALR